MEDIFADCPLSSSVIDIWSLQPQPHLQPQATLHGPTSASASPTPEEGSQLTVSADNISQRSRPTSGGTVPKHWGEVVVNPSKKRSRHDLNTTKDSARDVRDVFGVLKVN
jgi:hypothetical protein